jgi:S1-C subfamily serine protease
MEELNKNQIVLLVLLVSFVTSIATGIVTVTLMDQAPAAVTQTINRIVERTVEKIVPGAPPPPVIKEVQVIVTEEDLIVKVINGALPGIVRIISAGEDKTFISSGFFVPMDGVIAASGALVATATSTTSYQAILADGNVVPLTNLTPVASSTSPIPDLNFFKLAPLLGSNQIWKWTELTLAKELPAIGQTVVALGYSDRPDVNVAVGIISSFLSTGVSTKSLVMTNAASGENLGGPLMNIKGEVVGMSQRAGFAVSSEAIATALATLK